jgi:hypothetical protein
MLTQQDLNSLRRSIHQAVTQEWPQIETLLADVAQLEVMELGWRTANAVAPVASDGGDIGLTFHPMNLEFIRVVDSDGKVHIQEVVGLSDGPKALRNILRQEPVATLARLTNVEDPADLSQFLHEMREDRWPPNMPPAHVRNVIAHVRDIVEWAVLLKLAWEKTSSKRLIIRDGLLRTLALSQPLVTALSESFRQAYEENGTLLVAVAKRTQLLNYISVALELNGTFRREYPCFAQVPERMQRKAYRGNNWLGGYGFGVLHLAKLSSDPDGWVLPVDVPHWLMDRRKEVLEYLASTARGSFPKVGYPYPLVQAHEYASMNGFDVSVVMDMVVRSVLDGKNSAEAERILRHITIGRAISTRGG